MAAPSTNHSPFSIACGSHWVRSCWLKKIKAYRSHLRRPADEQPQHPAQAESFFAQLVADQRLTRSSQVPFCKYQVKDGQDFDLPFYPHGEFHLALDANDARLQIKHDPQLDGQKDGANAIKAGGPLCRDLKIRINGFSIASSGDDQGRTIGIPSFLLIKLYM